MPDLLGGGLGGLLTLPYWRPGCGFLPPSPSTPEPSRSIAGGMEAGTRLYSTNALYWTELYCKELYWTNVFTVLYPY